MRAFVRVLTTSVLTGLLALAATSVFAQATTDDDPAAAPEAGAAAQQPLDLEELQRQIEILAEELEALRSGETATIEVTPERQRALGLAPSAAATYERATTGVSLAGYGEMLLQNFAEENESGAGGAPPTNFDFLRAILYAGYRFNDRFLFNSEIEVEHADEIFVEFAYVDYMASEHLTVRGGMVLIPLGLVNEFHEPTVFLGAKRPETESRIIPSTWRENGAGILGSVGLVNYRAFVTNGFNGAAFNSSGLRGGRQKGSAALSSDIAFSGRLDVAPVPGVFAGVGLYTGGSGQEQVVLDGEEIALGTTIAEAHGQAQMRGFDVRALFARATVDDAGRASTALGLSAPIAETMQGGYIQVGYDLLSQTTADVALTPYVRYELVDTQYEVPAGFTRDRSRDGTFTTLGIELKPIPNVVVKTDYQWISNEAGTGRNQFNINLGYAF
jgi:hypothetical protein